MPYGSYRSIVSVALIFFTLKFIRIFLALSGILFPGKEEASYSNFRLWESTGSVITYAYSPYLCTDVKLYLLLGLLLIGATGYTVVEYLQYKNNSEDGDVKAKGKFELVNKKNKSDVAE